MKKLSLVFMVLGVASLGACQTLDGRGNKELMGGGAGAVIGGILGSQIGGGSGQNWAVGAGVLIGALIGSDVGASLDKADLIYAERAASQARTAPIGETITWNNPDTGNSGEITPVRDGKAASGRYCREYQQTIMVGGKEESAYGSACRKPDGSWEIVNN